MTTFDKREEGFEKKFAMDEESRFKANARRNKLLGLWAAQKLGLSGPAADSYAKEVVVADFEEAGDGGSLERTVVCLCPSTCRGSSGFLRSAAAKAAGTMRIESDAYPFTTKTYPIGWGCTTT